VVDFLGDLAVDRSGGDLYLTWLRSASIGGPILVSRCSADALRGLAGGGPLACDPAVQATPAGRTATSTRALAVGGDGRVYVAWLESAEENNAAFDFIGPYTVQVASSVDHGHTFSAPTSADRLAFVCPTFTCPNEAGYVQMSLAAGPDPGHVVVAATGTGADGRARVRVTVSRDGAATWSARRTVGGRVGEADHEQHMPHLAVAPDGRVDLDYYDLRPDLGQDLFVASSTDGGTTFGSPRRFSDVSSDEAIISSSFSDDRVIGMASSNAGAYAAWADSRRGTRDSGKVDVVFATDAAPPGTGYRTAAADGGVFAFGSASFLGSMGSTHLNSPVVGMAASPTGRGYWLVASDGGVFAFGDARFLGSTASLHLSSPVVQVTATPTGLGYWLVAADGGVFAFGDARFLGSTGAIQLNRPVVALAPTPSGRGYWLVASDGGVFAFGDARFLGSTGGLTLNSPVVGAAATPTGRGYWLVAADGGVFAFGDARFLGSAGSLHLASPVVGMAATSSSRGYWLTARDGGVFAFGDARFLGSSGALVLRAPVVGLAA
jgi:hypothetical protein